MRSEKGTTLIEFAVAFPIIIAFIFGTIFLGLYMNSQIAVNSAARDAARMRAVGEDLDNIAEAAHAQLADYGLRLDGSGVEDGPGQRYYLSNSPRAELVITDHEAEFVEVELSYSQNPIVSIPGVSLEDEYLISASVIYSKEVEPEVGSRKT